MQYEHKEEVVFDSAEKQININTIEGGHQRPTDFIDSRVLHHPKGHYSKDFRYPCICTSVLPDYKSVLKAKKTKSWYPI